MINRQQQNNSGIFSEFGLSGAKCHRLKLHKGVIGCLKIPSKTFQSDVLLTICILNACK